MSIGTAGAIAVDHISTAVQGMHTSISGAWIDRLGPVARPARAVNEAVIGLTYGSVRGGASLVAPVVDALVDENSRGADRMVAIVASLWGDTADIRLERLATTMSARDTAGTLVHPSDGAPEPVTSRLVVLIHGLSQTDDCWAGPGGLLEELDRNPDLSVITIRYNPALPIASNGDHLDALLMDITDRWPVPLESVSLVGYSMGGVVAHHALAAGERRGRSWFAIVDDVISIGAPHGGSRIETAVTSASMALRIARHTRPLADFVDSRSRGIKDLHTDVDRPAGPGDPTHVRYHFVTGGITRRPTNPISIIAGDLVVHPASASGPSHLTPTSQVRLGGVHHIDLVRDPAVVMQVVAWLTAPDRP